MSSKRLVRTHVKSNGPGRDIGSNLPSNMKDFLKINRSLFFRGVEGLLIRCVSRQEGSTRLHRLHHEMCGVNLDVGLYKRLQRPGVFWLEMASDAREEQRDCKTCSIIPPNQAKVLTIKVQEKDWQDPFVKYLSHGVLPADCLKREKLKRYATRFKMVDGKLLKRSFQGKWLVCIPSKEVKGILSYLHEGEPAGHVGGRKLWKIALHQGYYWPIMQRDAQDFAKNCQECQRRGDEIHISQQSLHPTMAPY